MVSRIGYISGSWTAQFKRPSLVIVFTHLPTGETFEIGRGTYDSSPLFSGAYDPETTPDYKEYLVQLWNNCKDRLDEPEIVESAVETVLLRLIERP
jgi:hypothetical protein